MDYRVARPAVNLDNGGSVPSFSNQDQFIDRFTQDHDPRFLDLQEQMKARQGVSSAIPGTDPVPGVEHLLRAMSTTAGRSVENGLVYNYDMCICPVTLTPGQPVFFKRMGTPEAEDIFRALKERSEFLVALRDVKAATAMAGNLARDPYASPQNAAGPALVRRLWTVQTLNASLYDLQYDHYVRNPINQRGAPRWRTAQNLLTEVPILYAGIATKVVALQPTLHGFLNPVTAATYNKIGPNQVASGEKICSVEITLSGTCPHVINQFDRFMFTGSTLFAVIKQVNIDKWTAALGPPSQAILPSGDEEKFGEQNDSTIRDLVDTTPYEKKPRTFFRHLITAPQAALDHKPPTLFWQIVFLSQPPWCITHPVDFLDTEAVNSGTEFDGDQPTAAENAFQTYGVFKLGFIATPNVPDPTFESTTYDSCRRRHETDKDRRIARRVQAVRWLRSITPVPWRVADEAILSIQATSSSSGASVHHVNLFFKPAVSMRDVVGLDEQEQEEEEEEKKEKAGAGGREVESANKKRLRPPPPIEDDKAGEPHDARPAEPKVVRFAIPEPKKQKREEPPSVRDELPRTASLFDKLARERSGTSQKGKK